MCIKNCFNCANNVPNQLEKCKALNYRIKDNCFAWADNKTLISRLKDIINYTQINTMSYNEEKGSVIYKINKELKELETETI